VCNCSLAPRQSVAFTRQLACQTCQLDENAWIVLSSIDDSDDGGMALNSAADDVPGDPLDVLPAPGALPCSARQRS
jgi:hypothetical protein